MLIDKHTPSLCDAPLKRGHDSGYNMMNTLDSLLRFGKNVIKPIVKPLLVLGALSIGGYLYGQQYHAKNPDKINVWKQSEIVNDYYSFQGSGDIDGDKDRNMNDILAMDNGVKNIQADINLNGVWGPAEGDMEDRQLLLDNINNGTALPYDWNAKNTRAEKDSTAFKVTAIDGISRDEIPSNSDCSNPPTIQSAEYAEITQVFHKGWKKQNPQDNDLPPIFDPEKNNITGLPFFYTSYRNPDTGFNHGIVFYFGGDDPSNPNNITVGVDDPLDPYDWTGIEPQNNPPNVLLKFGQNYFPPENVQFTVRDIKKWFDFNGCNYNFDGPIVIGFQVNSQKKLELSGSPNSNLIMSKEQAMDETYPTLIFNGPANNSIQNSKQTLINIISTDEHPDGVGYILNGAEAIRFPTTSDTSFYVDSEEGVNELLAYAEDKAGNQTLEKRVYTADSTYVGVEDEQNIPQGYSLEQNYPNPFNPSTTISYYLPQEGNVELNIYNLKGHKLETLVNGKQIQGEHKIIWDAEKYPAGIYLYQLQTPNSIKVKKMISLK